MRNSRTLEFMSNINKYQNIEKLTKRLVESDKLKEDDREEIKSIFNIESGSDEEAQLDNIYDTDYDLIWDELDDEEQMKYLDVAKSIRRLGPEEAFIDVIDELNNKAKTNGLEKDILTYVYLEKLNSKKLTEAANNGDEIQLYMNTWGNYNEYGADVEAINGGWMSIDQAKEFLEAHKDEEPFINDTENVPGDLDIDEYSNPWQVIEELEYIENCDNPEALIAIIESTSNDFEENKRIYENGDYTFFDGVDNDEDLGRAYVDMVGGLEGINNVANYIDEDAYRESWRDAAEDSVREENPDLDENSEEFESKVEEWLNGVVPEQLELAKENGEDLSNYFDYEAFGRDLDYEGYYFASTGAIQTL